MTEQALSPTKLISIISSSADTIASPLEAIAAFSHACMLAAGFRFLGYGEDHKAELEFDETHIQKLWTSDAPSHREFRYAHSQSSLEFIIKVSRMGGKTVIMGVAVEDDKTTSFDVKTEDYTSAGFFPWNTGNGQHIVKGFIGENRLKDLASLFKINILQKLIPGLSKSGYTEEQTGETRTETQPRRPNPAAPRPLFHPPNPDINDPLRVPPRRPYDPEPMPDWEDPYDLNRPLPLFGQPSNSPLSIGHDDLNPPGIGSPFNPIGGGLGPTGLPTPGTRGGQGGMFMDISRRGRGGRPPGVPPGARWDPIGPGRGGRGGGRGGGPNPFGGYMDDDFI